MQKMSGDSYSGQIKALPGMFTVEAAFVVPMFIIIIVWLLFFGIYNLERAYVISKVDVIIENAAQSAYLQADVKEGSSEITAGHTVGQMIQPDVKKAQKQAEQLLEKMKERGFLVLKNIKFSFRTTNRKMICTVESSSHTIRLLMFGNFKPGMLYRKEAVLWRGTQKVRSQLKNAERIYQRRIYTIL